jgi:hypothetical protein
MYYLTASIKAREEGIKTKLKLEESGQSGELTLDVKGNSER